MIPGSPTSWAVWMSMSARKREALRNAVNPNGPSGNDINLEEAKLLREIFGKPKSPGGGGGGTPGGGGGGTPGGGGGGTPGTVPEDQPVQDPGGGFDGGEFEQGDGFDNERLPRGNETENDTPTTRPGRGKIEVPKPANRANYQIPQGSDANRLAMPNVDKAIKKEIQKLTLRIVTIARDFVESGVDYVGIDYVPDVEIIGEDGNPYFPLPIYNTPPTESTLAEERMEEIANIIQRLLNMGVRGTQEFNYAEYLNLFELRYNASGVPTYKFSIELTGAIIEDLEAILIEDDSQT